MHAEGRWVFPKGHTSIPLEVRRAFSAGKSKRLLFPSRLAVEHQLLSPECCDGHEQRVCGVLSAAQASSFPFSLGYLTLPVFGVLPSVSYKMCSCLLQILGK